MKAVILLALVTAPFAARAETDFAHQVAPILKQHCAKCHLGEAKKGGFSMNTREALLEGSENGGVVEPGKADGAKFLEVLTTHDEDIQMPPNGDRVPPEQIAVLRTWIAEGMRWEPGFTFGKTSYEPPLKPRKPELPPVGPGGDHPVDRILDAYFAQHGMTPPGPLDDASFLRRLSLDLTGLLPDEAEVGAFTGDSSPDKRAKKIAEVLGRDTAYAEHWLSFWNDLLRNDYQGTGYIDGGRRPISSWLYQALLTNEPYNRFAVGLLAPPTEESAGFINGIQWRGSVNASQTREVQFAQSISQTFLGLNMKCASCHDSFVDRWKLDEAYGLAAIFAEGPLEIARCDKPTGRMAKAGWIFPELGTVDAAAPRPERLKQLAALMTHPDNGRFTRTLVNRLWHRLMGRGITHPVDAMDTPPWNADLLDYLASRFAEDGYDIKKALAFLASSRAYQSKSVVTKESSGPYVFRGPAAKRMTAEQFVDAVWTLTGTAPAAPHKSAPKGGAPEALTGKWIWSKAEASASATAGESIALGTEVDLPEAPVSVTAVFSCDNSCVVLINGRQAGASDDWQTVAGVSLEGFRSGKNTIVINAKNGGDGPNPAGLYFQARLRFPNAPPMTVATGPDWKWSASPPSPGSSPAINLSGWQPAAAVANQGLWGSVSGALASGLREGPAGMVRASLVQSDPLMRALGRPNREQIVSMRPDNLTTLEAIDLANGEILSSLLRRGAEKLAKDTRSTSALVDDIFLKALSRPPAEGERAELTAALGAIPSAQSIEDLLWLVLLLPEFQFVR